MLMAVDKLSISLDRDVAAAARAMAEAEGRSLSGWLAELIRREAQITDGLAAMDAWEAEHGSLTEDEKARADEKVRELLRRVAEG